MHKQRLAIVVCALIGIIAVFLPWVSISMFGESMSLNLLNEAWEGFAAVAGFISIALFAVAAVVAVLKEKSGPILSPNHLAAAGCGLLAVVVGLVAMLSQEGAMSFAGMGFYLSMLAGVGIAVITFVLKGDAKKPTE